MIYKKGNICGTYTGPINLPNQVCIVGVGKIKDEPTFVKPHKQVDGKVLYEVEMQKKVFFLVKIYNQSFI